MASEINPAARPQVQLVDRLRERLEQAAELTTEMRGGLQRADAAAIEQATARLETLALEFKLLYAEYGRIPQESSRETGEDLSQARQRLQRTTTELARSAAIHGGLLERMISLSNNLMGAVQSARSETYLPSGRPGELPAEGLRLDLKDRA